LFRLATVCPHSAAHVEAPDPDIIMRRSATSERTVTPAKALCDKPGDFTPIYVTVEMTLGLRPTLDNAARCPHLHRHNCNKGAKFGLTRSRN
jgi:hypothetical protein